MHDGEDHVDPRRLLGEQLEGARAEQEHREAARSPGPAWPRWRAARSSPVTSCAAIAGLVRARQVDPVVHQRGGHEAHAERLEQGVELRARLGVQRDQEPPAAADPAHQRLDLLAEEGRGGAEDQHRARVARDLGGQALRGPERTDLVVLGPEQLLEGLHRSPRVGEVGVQRGALRRVRW